MDKTAAKRRKTKERLLNCKQSAVCQAEKTEVPRTEAEDNGQALAAGHGANWSCLVNNL